MIGQLCLPHSLRAAAISAATACRSTYSSASCSARKPEQPVLADLHDPLRARGQAHHQRLRQRFELRRHRHAGHQRNVRGLDAAVGEIDRGRRLRGARHADQHHVGLLHVVDVLAVVVQHGVVQRIDALEIFGVEHVLRADPRLGFAAEIGLEQAQHRTENRQARHAEFAAGFLQPLGQLRLEQRVEHDARRGLDLGQHPVELLARAHQRMHVLDRRHRGILRRRRARDRDQGLAGRVGDQMQMEIIGAALRHVITAGHPVERWGGGHAFRPGASTSTASSAKTSPPSIAGRKSTVPESLREMRSAAARDRRLSRHYALKRQRKSLSNGIHRTSFRTMGIAGTSVDGLWTRKRESNPRRNRHYN